MHTDKALIEIRRKISIVKSNRDKYRHPNDILICLSIREAQIMDNLYFLMQPIWESL